MLFLPSGWRAAAAAEPGLGAAAAPSRGQVAPGRARGAPLAGICPWGGLPFPGRSPAGVGVGVPGRGDPLLGGGSALAGLVRGARRLLKPVPGVFVPLSVKYCTDLKLLVFYFFCLFVF